MRSPREYSISIVVRFSFNSYTIHKTHAKVLSHLFPLSKVSSIVSRCGIGSLSFSTWENRIHQYNRYRTRQNRLRIQVCGAVVSVHSFSVAATHVVETIHLTGEDHFTGTLPLLGYSPLLEMARLLRQFTLSRQYTWLARLTLLRQFTWLARLTLREHSPCRNTPHYRGGSLSAAAPVVETTHVAEAVHLTGMTLFVGMLPLLVGSFVEAVHS